MNTKILAMFVIGELLSLSCHAQGTFQNLDFEAATVGLDPTPRTVSFASAFPGWSGEIMGVPTLYNNRPLDASGIALFGPNSQFSGLPLVGLYTAALQGGTFSSSPPVSLAQTGIVPFGTMSLRFVGRSSRGNFIVSLNDQPIVVTALQDFGNYSEFGADIASFAGQTAELRFTQPAGPNQYGIFFLDQISFSTTAVPEPSTWALLALGSALFCYAAHRRRK